MKNIVTVALFFWSTFILTKSYLFAKKSGKVIVQSDGKQISINAEAGKEYPLFSN